MSYNVVVDIYGDDRSALEHHKTAKEPHYVLDTMCQRQ